MLTNQLPAMIRYQCLGRIFVCHVTGGAQTEHSKITKHWNTSIKDYLYLYVYILLVKALVLISNQYISAKIHLKMSYKLIPNDFTSFSPVFGIASEDCSYLKLFSLEFSLSFLSLLLV